jgi:hypothetical protein
VASYEKDDLYQGRTAKTCAKPPKGPGIRNTTSPSSRQRPSCQVLWWVNGVAVVS